MTALIVLGSVSLYLAGLAFVTRRLFCRWRPSRVPLCGAQRHYSSGCPQCYGPYQRRASNPCTRTHHTTGCYQRRKADLTTVHIDRDSHAAGWAAFAALAWPFVLFGFALMARPPELPGEQARRVKELERKLADMEREAGVDPNRD